MTKKFYGDHPSSTGSRQVSQQPSTKAAVAPIETDRWYRNGKHPDAKAMSLMNGGVNAAMLYRTKSVFDHSAILGAAGGISGGSFGAGDYNRFRFAFHSSPYTHALFCRFLMYPQSSGFEYDSYAKLRIYSDAAESSLVTTTEFHYGSNPLQSGLVTGWQYLRVVDKMVEGLTPDTDYFGLITDVDYGITHSVSIADLQSMSDNYSGYLPTSITEETQILDKYRENLVTAIPPMWKRGAAKVLTWSVEAQSTPQTIAVNTATNIIDGTSTTYGSSIPGWTLDMTGKARLSQSTGVPIVMKAYMSNSSGTNGVVHLRDSAGAVVATCTNTRGAGVAGWITSTGTPVLPASSAKYYITHQTAAGTLSTGAVSVYEYES